MINPILQAPPETEMLGHKALQVGYERLVHKALHPMKLPTRIITDDPEPISLYVA